MKLKDRTGDEATSGVDDNQRSEDVEMRKEPARVRPAVERLVHVMAHVVSQKKFQIRRGRPSHPGSRDQLGCQENMSERTFGEVTFLSKLGVRSA
jgi:hypothetical protein